MTAIKNSFTGTVTYFRYWFRYHPKKWEKIGPELSQLLTVRPRGGNSVNSPPLLLQLPFHHHHHNHCGHNYPDFTKGEQRGWLRRVGETSGSHHIEEPEIFINIDSIGRQECFQEQPTNHPTFLKHSNRKFKKEKWKEPCKNDDNNVKNLIELSQLVSRNVLGNNTLGEILSERESIASAIKVENPQWPT